MRRIPELDTLRGILLVVMTFTHLPTRLSQYADQPLGFVSTAEAFIFLSAYVAGRAYAALLAQGRSGEVRRRAWARCRELYLWHLGMLAAVFILGSVLASFGAQARLQNLLSVYFSDPVRAIASAVALGYQPPLLDILPMYIVFLAFTPLLLGQASKGGWSKPLALSALLWLFAQLDGRALLFHGLQTATGWPFPLESLGAFDWFAWQSLWVTGLALAHSHDQVRDWILQRRSLVVLSVFVAVAFFWWRHQYHGAGTELWAISMHLDKWHLGALRVLNFAALGIVVASFGLPMLRSAVLRGFSLLGRASLEVFCTHVLACILCVSLLLDERSAQPVIYDLLMLCGTLVAMFAVALRTTRGRMARDAVESAGIRASH